VFKPKMRIHEVVRTASTIEVSLRYPEAAYNKLTRRMRLGLLAAETLELAGVTGILDENKGTVTVTDGEAHMVVRLGGLTILRVLQSGDRAVQKRIEALRKQVEEILRRLVA
jgi:hypothetical protein